MSVEHRQKPIIERRKGPDWVSLSLSWYAVTAWLLFIVCLVIVHFARPEYNTGLVRYWGIEVRNSWHPQLTEWLLYLLFACSVFSLLSVIVNKMRMRRKTDFLRVNLLLLFLMSLSFLLYLLWL